MIYAQVPNRAVPDWSLPKYAIVGVYAEISGGKGYRQKDVKLLMLKKQLFSEDEELMAIIKIIVKAL